jgi:hypothetical protein
VQGAGSFGAGGSASTGISATGITNGVNALATASTTNAAAVSGTESATSGAVFGVAGFTNSQTDGAAGVGGEANATTGQVYGVGGITNSTSELAAGVAGQANSTTGQVYGVFGVTNSTTSDLAAGVAGLSNATTGAAVGVLGATQNSGGVGVKGLGTTGGVGVLGANRVCSGGTCTITTGTAGSFSTGAGGTLLLGTSGSSTTTQTTQFSVDSSGNGFFAGNLNVTGKVSKGSGSFKIDDPLDPANKYLSHSFVESPDMMNVYNGNVMTDKLGRAVVELPEYFEVLNRDFRYQLTVVGQFAQAIVAKEIANNRFVIRTSKPGVKVSWQVTGIRQDAYANANRIPVEEDKPEGERGYYLHPEVFGQPATKGIVVAHRPDVPAATVAALAAAAKP